MYFDDLNEQNIFDQRQEIKSMIDSMLKNWSQRYYSHNSNIKCVDSTIKCIGFKSFHYAINLDVVSSFVVFNDFDFMFLLLVGIDEIIFLF